MPRGVYLLDGPGVLETFSCAPGPSGWRYVSHRDDGASYDLTCDAGGRVLRLRVAAGGRSILGGIVGASAIWIDSMGVERETVAAGFAGDSPGLLVATARLLRRRLPAEAVLTEITAPSLAVLTVRRRWTHLGSDTHPTDLGPLLVEAYAVDDPDTGARQQVHLAGDVVVAADGVALLQLEQPPTRD